MSISTCGLFIILNSKLGQAMIDNKQEYKPINKGSNAYNLFDEVVSCSVVLFDEFTF